MRRRVAVTGMGVICPIGNSPDEFRENLLLGVSGVGPVTLFDPASLPTRIAAEVKWRGPVLRVRKDTVALEAPGQALGPSGRARGGGGGRLGSVLGIVLVDCRAAYTRA